MYRPVFVSLGRSQLRQPRSAYSYTITSACLSDEEEYSLLSYELRMPFSAIAEYFMSLWPMKLSDILSAVKSQVYVRAHGVGPTVNLQGGEGGIRQPFLYACHIDAFHMKLKDCDQISKSKKITKRPNGENRK